MRRLLAGRPGVTWYVIVDAAALVVFVLIGLRGHRVSTVEGFLRTAVPLLGSWFLVASLSHAYRRPGWRSLLRTWIVAVPVGLLIRTLIVGSPNGVRSRVHRRGLAVTLVSCPRRLLADSCRARGIVASTIPFVLGRRSAEIRSAR